MLSGGGPIACMQPACQDTGRRSHRGQNGVGASKVCAEAHEALDLPPLSSSERHAAAACREVEATDVLPFCIANSFWNQKAAHVAENPRAWRIQ